MNDLKRGTRAGLKNSGGKAPDRPLTRQIYQLNFHGTEDLRWATKCECQPFAPIEKQLKKPCGNAPEDSPFAIYEDFVQPDELKGCKYRPTVDNGLWEMGGDHE